MDLAIVHYNTPELTGALVRSIRKWMPDAGITIFDNSDARPFHPDGPEIYYIDNTRAQVVDFDTLLARHPRRSTEHAQDASVKHMASVDALFDFLPDGFILLDSDVLLRRDLSELADPAVAWSAEIQYGMTFGSGRFRPRALPFVCWVNVPMCREAGIRYFDETRSWKLEPGVFYDTGASFYLDCKKAGLPGREIRWGDYVVHLKGGSWDARDPTQFLRENRALYV